MLCTVCILFMNWGFQSILQQASHPRRSVHICYSPFKYRQPGTHRNINGPIFRSAEHESGNQAIMDLPEAHQQTNGRIEKMVQFDSQSPALTARLPLKNVPGLLQKNIVSKT